MSKKTFMLKAVLSALLAGLFTIQAQAAFTLNGTRYIYEEGRKNISFEVTNNAKETYGGQVWIDNISQGKGDVFIIPSPPFFKINAGNKQIMRLMNVSDALPGDRESLFMLNVQEVPPVPKNAEGNVVAIAMNTRVKLFYRPKILVEKREKAESQLTLENRNGSVWIKNPTPYYFAVIKVKNNGKAVKLSDEVIQSLSQLAPFTETNTGANLSGEVSVDALNDWGGIENYVVK